MAFGVKQRKPKTIEAAVAATLELESYLVSHSTPGTVAPVQVPVDRAGQKSLMDMMSQIMTRMEKLEAKNFKQKDGVSDKVNRPVKPVTQVLFHLIQEWLCVLGVDKKAILL